MSKLYVIKSRFDGRVLFSLECGSLKLCVEAAVKARAYLVGANLVGASLARANLADAYLVGANLAGADLADANLVGANLADASLVGANLARANLAGAYLVGANLAHADLARANLADAYLVHADNIPDIAISQSRILPEGALIGWKKCNDGVIVKLRIPEDAKRSSAFGRKCRAEFVDVLEVIGSDVGVTNTHGPITEYRAGQRVTADGWCENFTRECASGIHFFITRAEAEQW